MAAEIKEALGVDAVITPGSRGQFDVIVDDVVRYSKAETHRFPEPGEVMRLLKG